jgi:hypothetical protein
MSFFKRIFAMGRVPAASSLPHSQLVSGHSQGASVTTPDSKAARRELLGVVLRDTLHRHGIPTTWIGAEIVASMSRSGVQGFHWRLVLKHWDPRLMIHGVALEQSLVKRLMIFDPMASSWLMGISWRFQVPDVSLCPPMPHPGTWTADPPAPTLAPKSQTTGGTGDVIAGPVRIAGGPDSDKNDVAADLQRLLAERDADYTRHADNQADPEKTQPMYLNTQPARL